MSDNSTKRSKPPRGSSAAPDHIMLSIRGDAKTGMAVTWRTDETAAPGYLLLRPEWGGERETVRFDAVTRRFESDIDVSLIHTAAAEGLTPGARYFYTVGDDACRSAEFSFETEPESLTHYRFIVIADQQNSTPFATPEYAPVRRMLGKAFERCPDARFILTLGDNVSNGQNELQWNGLFHGLRGFCERVPLMMATGNHDNRGYRVYDSEETQSGKFYLEHADFFDAQFEEAYPKNGPEGYTTENYSFDYGDAHFTILGINEFAKIGDWAVQDMAASDKTWKLGVFHFPVFPIMPEGVSGQCLEGLSERLDAAKPDVMFAGHEHSFARSYPIRGYQMFDRPSQGTVHYILGNSGENIFTSNADKVWYYNFYPQEEYNCMYAVVDVTPERLTVSAYLDDGRAVDEFSIDKSRDEIYPPLVAPVYHRTRMAYKGALVELCARDISARRVDGTFFVPFAVCAQAVGAEVVKEPGRVTIDLYGVRAVFAEGSDSALKNGAEEKLSHPVFRGDKGELYVAADDLAAVFGLRWVYAERNNFIDFDYPEEDYPRSVQPAGDGGTAEAPARHAAFGAIRAPGVNPAPASADEA